MPTTPIRDLRREARDRLAAAGLPNPSADADALLAAVLGSTRGDVALGALLAREIAEDDARRVRDAIARRSRREPLQHIVGSAPFGRLELSVGPGVFVPRPETEMLVELAVAAIRGRGAIRPRIADVGSGSGAVALGIAHELALVGIEASVWAIEASPHAWPWLVRNVRELGHGRVHPVFDRITADVTHEARRAGWASSPGALPLDALVSNPPYVPRANEPTDPEVRRHDPGVALYGGDDGLDVIRDLARLGRRTLARGGAIVLEHDDHQGEDVRGILARAGYRDARTHVDLAGRDRVTGASAP